LQKGLWLAAAAVALLALGVAGCGGGSDGEEESSTQRAVAEIGEVRMLLDEALDEYREGNPVRAEEIVGNAYLEHFEALEEPLEERDEELMEELEVQISTTIRNRMKEGAPASRVEELVDEADQGLSEAESLLASESD